MADVNQPEALAAVIRGIADELPESNVGLAIAVRVREVALSPVPTAAAASGHLLLHLGFVGLAGSLFQALQQLFPAVPAGLTGLAQVAMQRKDWAWALRRWDEVMAAFPRHEAYWLAARAQVLYELGCREEATVILHAVGRDFGLQPHGYIGLAQLAMRQQLWTDSLGLWDEVLARFPQHDGHLFSKISRASVLLQLGRLAGAETTLRDVIRADPWMVGAHAVLLRVLAANGRYDEAARGLQASIFADAAVPVLCRANMEILMAVRRLDEARTQFGRYLQCAMDFDSIGILFGAVPRLFEGWRRTEIWIDLLRRLDDFEARTDPDALHLHRVLSARIKLALRDHRGYLHEARRLDGLENLGELGNTVRAVAAALEDPHFPDFSKRKIFGIGLTRTGTTTLAAALTALGMNTLHWTNSLTCELISDDDLHLFDAFTDTPVCTAFEKYYYMFPASKFIYTMRPLDSWIDSMNRHWRRALGICEFSEFQRQLGTPHTFRFGSEFCRIQRVLYLNHAELRQANEAYDQRVRRFFSDKPKDRFLAFNVFEGHGWRELCEFLGSKAPALPFPCENTSADASEAGGSPARA